MKRLTAYIQSLMLVIAVASPLDMLAVGMVPTDTTKVALAGDTIAKTDEAVLLASNDSAKLVKLEKKTKRNWATWKPDPKRAMWLAVVLPGAGQIYNRKYWKLPIIYGGFVGCAYAMRWNNQMFKDYSQAYIDIMDDNPETKSYEQFLHLGAQITSSNIERYKTVFKKRKDRFRRYRDLSFFCMLGVYGLSIIDAYVDASLSQFDISDDLSLRVGPGFVNDGHSSGANAFSHTGLGFNAELTF